METGISYFYELTDSFQLSSLENLRFVMLAERWVYDILN